MRRFLLGVFAAYLIGLLGYLAPSHSHHGKSGAHGKAETHQDCTLCHVGHQPFLSGAERMAFETPAGPVALVQAVWAPILASRHQPFSSRAPPSV